MLVRISDFPEFQNDWAHSVHTGEMQLFNLSLSLPQRVQNFVPETKFPNPIFYFKKKTKKLDQLGNSFHSFVIVASDVLNFPVLTYLNTVSSRASPTGLTL